jgi:hypothetical protein
LAGRLCTLVLLIPFNGGLLLVSDRQSTKRDGTKEPWNKIYKVSDKAAIGLSGGSEESRFLAEQLQTIQEPLPLGYTLLYQRLNMQMSLSRDDDIESLCITKERGQLECYKFTRSVPNSIQPIEPVGIGSGEHIIRPQLSGRQTGHLTLSAAIDFGKTLIQYASIVDNNVGPPSLFGFCQAVVPMQGEISIHVVPPELVAVDRMLYQL